MVQEVVGDRGQAMTGIHYDLIIIGGGPAGQGAAEFVPKGWRRNFFSFNSFSLELHEPYYTMANLDLLTPLKQIRCIFLALFYRVTS